MEERYPVGVTESCAVAVLRHEGDAAGYASWSATIGLRTGEATIGKFGVIAAEVTEFFRRVPADVPSAPGGH